MFSCTAAGSPAPSTMQIRCWMPVRSHGRGHDAGTVGGGADRVDPAQQLRVGVRVACRAWPAVDRDVAGQPGTQPAGQLRRAAAGWASARVSATCATTAATCPPPGRRCCRAAAAWYRVDHVPFAGIVDVHAQQHRQAPRCGEFRGGRRRGGHHDRRVRPGPGPRHHRHLREGEELPGRAHLPAGEAGQQQVERLGEPGLVPVQPGAEHFQFHPRAATPDAEPEPAGGDLIEQRGLLGQRDRMRGGQHADRRADRYPPRARPARRRRA